MSNLTTIKGNIQRWAEIRNEKAAINFLTSGNGFLISDKDFEHWEPHNPETINCYLGVDENKKLKIYLVDNITDEQQEYELGVNLFEKKFQEYFEELPMTPRGIIHSSLEPTEADSRITNWVLCANAWFNHKQSLRQEEETLQQGEMVQVFTIPFSDLQELFVNQNLEALKATFGLKYYETEVIEGYDIEVILAKTEFNNDPEAGVSLVKESFADLSVPYPPGSTINKGFNLL